MSLTVINGSFAPTLDKNPIFWSIIPIGKQNICYVTLYTCFLSKHGSFKPEVLYFSFLTMHLYIFGFTFGYFWTCINNDNNNNNFFFFGFLHIVQYNIENWVWNLAGLELSPLCAACCRLVSSLENILASSGDYPQLNCHCADIEILQPVLLEVCYTSNHPTVLASR